MRPLEPSIHRRASLGAGHGGDAQSAEPHGCHVEHRGGCRCSALKALKGSSQSARFPGLFRWFQLRIEALKGHWPKLSAMLGLFLLLWPSLAQNATRTRRLDWAFGQGGCGGHFDDGEIQEFQEVSAPEPLGPS